MAMPWAHPALALRHGQDMNGSSKGMHGLHDMQATFSLC